MDDLFTKSFTCPLAADFQFSDALNHEYSKHFPNKGHASSLLALNIQRGRDFGLAPYIFYRKLAGLNFGSFYNFDDATIDIINTGFSKPEDTDLYLGLLAENRMKGDTTESLLGPTQACKSSYLNYNHLNEI